MENPAARDFENPLVEILENNKGAGSCLSTRPGRQEPGLLFCAALIFTEAPGIGIDERPSEGV